MITFKNRPLEILEIRFGKDPTTSYVADAYFTDTGESLSDDLLDELNIHRPDIATDAWFEKQIDKADQAADGVRDAK